MWGPGRGPTRGRAARRPAARPRCRGRRDRARRGRARRCSSASSPGPLPGTLAARGAAVPLRPGRRGRRPADLGPEQRHALVPAAGDGALAPGRAVAAAAAPRVVAAHELAGEAGRAPVRHLEAGPVPGRAAGGRPTAPLRLDAVRAHPAPFTRAEPAPPDAARASVGGAPLTTLEAPRRLSGAAAEARSAERQRAEQPRYLPAGWRSPRGPTPSVESSTVHGTSPLRSRRTAARFVNSWHAITGKWSSQLRPRARGAKPFPEQHAPPSPIAI